MSESILHNSNADPENILYILDPKIDWVTTYLKKIQFNSSRILFLSSAGLLTSHSKFDESKIFDPNIQVRIDLSIIFENVSRLLVNGEERNGLDILCTEDCNGQIDEIEFKENSFLVSVSGLSEPFSNINEFLIFGMAPFIEFGDYLFE